MIQLKVFHVQVLVEKVQVRQVQTGGVNDNVQVTKAKLSSVIGNDILVKGHISKFPVEVGVHITGGVFAAAVENTFELSVTKLGLFVEAFSDVIFVQTL